MKNTHQRKFIRVKRHIDTTKAKKLKDLRIAYGLSQKKFGGKLGYTREAIASYELGHNFVPMNVVLKINQVMGIGREYFESDMNVEEAFEKYEIRPATMIAIGNFYDVGFLMYEGIQSYIDNEPIKHKSKVKLEIFTLLFSLEKKTDYHFIRISNSKHEPFAKKGDILIVLKENKAVNGDFVIVRFKESIIIVQYFIAGTNEALFKGRNDVELQLKDIERE